MFTRLEELFSSTAIGGMMSLAVKSKTNDLVKCTVVDGGELKSRRHLNVRGKSANLPSITGYYLFSILGGIYYRYERSLRIHLPSISFLMRRLIYIVLFHR